MIRGFRQVRGQFLVAQPPARGKKNRWPLSVMSGHLHIIADSKERVGRVQGQDAPKHLPPVTYFPCGQQDGSASNLPPSLMT